MTAHLISEHTAQGQGSPAKPRPSLPGEITKPESCQDSTVSLLRCSFFDHAKDNQPKSKVLTWEQLKSILARVYSPGTPGDKRSMPAISPASYPLGVTRGRDFASGVGLLILDFDNAREEVIPGGFYLDGRTGEPTGRPKTRKVRIDAPVTMAEVTAALSASGVAAMAWSTWSSALEHEKFRVVIPLAASVPVDLWERASEWALTFLGLDPFRRGLDVPVLHNPAALAFLPGCPDPSTIRRAEASGALLAIPLDALPAAPLPTLAPWQTKVLEERQIQREQGNYWWQAYRVNGRPVDFQSLDLAAILEARGIKVGPSRAFKDGTKRRAHCPWAGEHSGGVDDDAAVIITTPNSWPSFRCMHAGHVHMGLRDLLEWAWGRP